MATLLTASAFAAEPKVIVPANGVPPVGPYSPGLLSGDYLYISGQGVRDSKSNMPEGIEAQTRQCLQNVQGILEAAGMTTANVVSVQIFLADLKTQPVFDRLYLAAYPANPPRVVMGAARMPTDTTVEITVVAHRNAGSADRIYLPAVYGSNQKDAESKLQLELKKAGLTTQQVVYANRYVTAAAKPGEIPVSALPNGAVYALFAIAAKSAPAHSAFCEVVASDPTGSVEDQTNSAFLKLKACLAAKGMTLADTVATNVYLDDMGDFTKMNAVYATYFPTQKPTRTTIQTAPSSKGSLVRLSAIASLTAVPAP